MASSCNRGGLDWIGLSGTGTGCPGKDVQKMCGCGSWGCGLRGGLVCAGLMVGLSLKGGVPA